MKKVKGVLIEENAILIYSVLKSNCPYCMKEVKHYISEKSWNRDTNCPHLVSKSGTHFYFKEGEI